MNISSLTTAMCKTIRSLGISTRKEHAIENTLTKQLLSSGPDYVISRIKSLTNWRKKHMQGDFTFHAEWFSYKNKEGRCVPTDAFGSQVWGLQDQAFFAVTGAILKSLTYDVPSKAQLSKWISAVRCKDVTSTDMEIHERMKDIVNPEFFRILETHLSNSLSCMKWFSIEDLHGCTIPCGANKYTISIVDKNIRDTNDLIRAYNSTIQTAPPLVWRYLQDLDITARSYEMQDLTVKDQLQQFFNARIEEFDSLHENFGLSEFGEKFDSEGVDLVDHNLALTTEVGSVGFIQEPGGKLRTVANPNRLVQWSITPFGQSLHDCVELEFSGQSSVMDHNRGRKWAQEKLRKGCSLTYCDNTSATDLYDWRKFVQDFFVEDILDKYPLTKRSLEYFDDLSSSPWRIPGVIQDALQAKTPYLSYSIGQPMGLRPSFPLLTLMNCCIARLAIANVLMQEGKPWNVASMDACYGSHFMCTGDDLIIESKYAPEYMKLVSSYNGRINPDKCTNSNKIAEFCSYLITRGKIYPLKPRLDLGTDYLEHIEKFLDAGLRPKYPRWVYKVYDGLAKYSMPESSLIPYSHTAKKLSFAQKLNAAYMLQLTSPGKRAPLEERTLQGLFLKESSSPASTRVKNIDSGNTFVVGNTFDYLSSLKINEDKLVSLSAATSWDTEENDYVPKTNTSMFRKKQAAKLAKSTSVQTDQDALLKTKVGPVNIEILTSPVGDNPTLVSFECNGEVEITSPRQLRPELKEKLERSFSKSDSVTGVDGNVATSIPGSAGHTTKLQDMLNRLDSITVEPIQLPDDDGPDL